MTLSYAAIPEALPGWDHQGVGYVRSDGFEVVWYPGQGAGTRPWEARRYSDGGYIKTAGKKPRIRKWGKAEDAMAEVDRLFPASA
jgi:hypothetical protein